MPSWYREARRRLVTRRIVAVISGLQILERRGIHAGVHAQDHAGSDERTRRCM
jgi:hypothetical protein